jgi:hypothetical protein
LECLCSGSDRRFLGPIFKPWQKLRSYVVWHIENFGWWNGLKTACLSRVTAIRIALGRKRSAFARTGRPRHEPAPAEVLGLQPGELVEVKSAPEILATLDANRRHKGLLWMTGMNKYCGRQYRVHRRLERILLESNGELRTMKNTVLLESVCCDGREFGGCDRSCFHFWREAWLRRVAD